MIALGELRTKASLENIRIIMHFIDGIGQRLQLSEKTVFDIELAVEEASVNIVNHAYPGEDKGDIVIRVDENDETLVITLKDWGIPFDESNVKPFDITENVEVRIRGGMGLHFIHNLMDHVDRTTTDVLGEENQLILYKQMERLRPGAHTPNAMRELNAMLNVSRVLSTNISLDDLLERIVNELVATIEAERGTLYLIDEERGELYSSVLSSDTGEIQEIRVKIGQGIAGQVAETGKILNIKDAYSASEVSANIDQQTGFRSYSILAAPMRNYYQKIIGVVQLLNKIDGEFTTRDERLLVAMASQAAISIENARLYAQEIQQQLINQELETARSIQESFMPGHSPEHQGWDIAYFWLPMRDVGGDFYDFYHLNDGRWAFVIADVSGKGVPAAMFMALAVTVIRFSMRLGLEPAELLDRCNQLIIADQTSKMFATTFVSYVDLDSGILQYASAGHNPPIVYRAATRSCEYLDNIGCALGVFDTAEFNQLETALNPGDILLMYTDGMTEVIDEDEEEFGEERIEEILIAHADATAEVLVSLIVNAVTEFSVDQRGFDDETMVIIKKVDP